MTDSFPHPVAADPQIHQTRFIQIPIEVIHHVRSLKLSGTQYDLWLYLYELDPYGNRWIEIPSPADIAKVLKVDPRTIQRSAQRLQDCDLFDFEIKRWKARNTTMVSKVVENSTGKGIHLRTKRSKRQPADQNVSNGISSPKEKNEQSSKLPQSNPLNNGHSTNNRSKDLNNRTAVPTPHPVLPNLDREILGTESQALLEAHLAKLSALIYQAGIRPNQTIQTTLVSLLHQQGSAAATQSVENALSAVIEQQQQGNCRNPGGMLVAALRRGFTGNQAKRNARERSTPEPQPEPPSLNQIAIAIDQALLRGDRSFALGKLQTLWADGWHNQLEELLQLRPDWGLTLTTEGVKDDTP